MTSEPLIRRVIAPEDIRVGDHIVVTRKHDQILPIWIEVNRSSRSIEAAQATLIPEETGQPVCVLTICLPFIMVMDVHEVRFPIDTRLHKLAYVSEAYALSAKAQKDDVDMDTGSNSSRQKREGLFGKHGR